MAKSPANTMAKAPPDKKSVPLKSSAGAKPAAKASAKTSPSGSLKPSLKPASKTPPPSPPPRAAKPHKPQPAFPKKNQPPTAAAFAGRLPLALGKRFELARGFLLKQSSVSEDVYFYGPESGWALRYRQEDRPLCSLHIYDEQPVGIVALDPAATAGIDWRALSPVALQARKQAHGSPALLWLDVPLEGTGASDLRTILRAKIASMAAASGPTTQRRPTEETEEDSEIHEEAEQEA